MKLRFIYFLILSLLGAYVLQSSRTGAAATFNLDRTGSPIANGLNCGACHSGALNNAAMTITVKDGTGTPVTTYTPGNVYSMEFNVTSNFGFSRGFQAVALAGMNAQAGSFSNPGTQTKISPLNGRQYVEHTTPALTANGFVFEVDWTAPVTGTGNVTIYASGIVGNGDNRTSTDDPIAPISLVLNEQAGAATIDYPQASYCQNATSNATPVITGNQNGVFSATPAGLVLNTNTGVITLASSNPGTYTVTYNYGTGTTTDQVTIQAEDDGAFSYPNASYCINDADPTPTITGLPGGFFSGSVGLVINSSTGTVDISATGIGSYTVSYSTNGPCPTIELRTFNITNLADASFSYGQPNYCQNDTDPIPTAATQGGLYTSTNGLVLNSTTGGVDLSASTPGTYTITYNTQGNCANTSTQSLTVIANDNAAFNYNSSAYCVNAADPTPSITTSGGTFGSSPSGLSLNSTTGQIDVSASSPGLYTITYTTGGTCPDAQTRQVTINGLDNANFSYNAASYCQNGTDPTPTVTGVTGGSFTSLPAGLSLNANTGRIDVSASTPNTYTITYTTNGTCSNTSTRQVVINATDDANFAYSAASYCQNDADPTPTVTLSGGTFSSSGGLVLNSSSGLIDLSASNPGTYTITYTTNGPCPNSNAVQVVVNAQDNGAFAYNAATYCQNDADPTPTVTGLGGGSFSSGAGLTLNANSGQIDLSASTPGTYTIGYTTVGACPTTEVRVITINATDNSTFTYSSNTYCATAADPSPVLGGLGGGTFSSTAGLALNTTSGQIDLSASTPGLYTVTYTTNGPCPSSSSQQVTVNAADNASFSYGRPSYCQNDPNNPTPTVTGLTGGTFSANNGMTINPNTGVINVANTQPGVYTVTYATNGPCPTSSTQQVIVNAADDAGFSYAASVYCRNGTDPTPTVTGLSGGTFTASGSLVINATTGQIDLSSAPQGTYVITYATNGSCPNSSTQTINLINIDDASFNYSASTYCTNGSPNPTPTVVTGGGSFSSSPVGLSLNATSGSINLAASTPGVYTVLYTTNSSCPNSSSQSITISAPDNASFTYGSTAYCQTDPDPTAVGIVSSGTFSSTNGLSINASTGRIDVSASTPGTYVVTFTTTGACPNSSTRSVTINALDDATFLYSGTSFCRNSNDPTPTIVGLSGGAFSSTPTGLVLNTTTGTVDVSASSLGTYAITYTTNGVCPNATSVSLTVDSIDNADFNYTAASYCQNGSDPTPNLTGFPGGTFSSTPAGLVLNASTGIIDVSASTVGSYNVTYTTTGACTNSATRTVGIDAADDASFSYSANAYCTNGTNPSPTVTGTPNGTFSGSAGLAINTTTGVINLSATAPGNYTVTYTTNGTCPATSTTAVLINGADDANFAYPAPAYCQGGIDPTPTVTTAGGTFSGSAGLVINATTGVIDLSASTAPVSHTITYTTNGTCPSSNTVNVFINATEDPNFSYSAASTCVGGTDLSATILGTSGGIFSSAPGGLALNASTGLINASSSAPGTYTVTYATTGACSASSSLSITINALDDANFAYAGAAFCENGGDPIPSVGTPGGTFSSTPTGLSLNPATGEVDLDNSTLGSYTITYTTNGTCPNSSSQPFAINAAQTASFNYTDTTICINGTANPTIQVTSSTTGQFTASPTGLALDITTGIIDVGNTTPGTYIVTYTTAGPCATTATTTVIASICGSVQQVEEQTAYELYPNPNVGEFTLEYSGSLDRASVYVTDAIGQVVHFQEVTFENQSTAIVTLPNPIAGTYWVRLQDAQQVQVLKMVVSQP